MADRAGDRPIRLSPSNGNPIDITVWWTPDCGALHVERNPASISMVCPDGLTGFAWEPLDAD